eukprot:2496273-Alexandrium_andersonii.AAC.1
MAHLRVAVQGCSASRNMPASHGSWIIASGQDRSGRKTSVCGCACVRARVCACARACARVCGQGDGNPFPGYPAWPMEKCGPVRGRSGVGNAPQLS